MLVEAANPVHSLADTARMREACEALDFLVAIDVALTETARLADYVLPVSNQFEKAEATFFNFEFPKNYFHLRTALEHLVFIPEQSGIEGVVGLLSGVVVWIRGVGHRCSACCGGRGRKGPKGRGMPAADTATSK